MTKTSRRIVYVLAGFPSVAALVAVLVGVLARSVTSRNQNELMREGKRLLAEVEAYHKLHQRYPVSFEEAGIRPDPRVIWHSSYGLHEKSGEFSFGLINHSFYTIFYFSRYRGFSPVEPPS